MARSKGWLLQTHANENRAEVGEVRRATGQSNVEYLHEVGLTGDDVVLAHGVHLEPAETELLASTGTRICHCPGTNLKLASGIADVPGLLEAGVPVVLGADGAPCNNRLSIFHEMRLAATLHSLRHGPRSMPPESVLAMATREGAKALHLDAEIGTLERGKRADVVVIDLGGWSMLPDGDPANRIVYGATTREVRHVLVDGKPLVVDGRLASEDERAIRARVASAWRDTRARMEESGWQAR
jgi:cytosine/adenosine deaminase-related metal-dependent hydrolase